MTIESNSIRRNGHTPPESPAELGSHCPMDGCGEKHRGPRALFVALLGTFCVLLSTICVCAQEAVPTPEELLKLTGIEEASLRPALEAVEADEASRLWLLSAISQLRTWPPELWNAWNQTPPKTGWLQLASLEGVLKSCKQVGLSRDILERFPEQSLYLCEIEPTNTSEAPFRVYASEIPTAWRKGEAAPKDARVAVAGIGLAETGGPLTLLSERIQWFPDLPLGRLGFDMGLFDAVRDAKPLSKLEREVFYRMLTTAVRDPENLIGPRFQATNVAPLFNAPQTRRGDRVLLDGTARRIIRIEVPDEDIRARFGIKHYYEVDLFTPDSQNNPLVLCMLELPNGVRAGGNVREHLRLQAYFLKTWAFRSGRPPEVVEGKPKTTLQLAPLLFVAHAASLRAEDEKARQESPWSTLIILVVGIAGVTVALWASRKTSPRLPLPDKLPPLTPPESAGAE